MSDCFASVDDDGGGGNLYLAPEVTGNQPYNEKVDIFSFGAILRLLLTGTAEEAARRSHEGKEEDNLTALTRYGPLDRSNYTSTSSSSIEPAERCAGVVSISMQLLIGSMKMLQPRQLISIVYFT